MKTYGLAIEKAFTLVKLNLPAMTLAQATESQNKLAAMGKHVLVVNLAAE